jgi:hypothetical protein
VPALAVMPRFENVAIPLTAVAVAVPISVPPELIDAVTVAVELVTVALEAS